MSSAPEGWPKALRVLCGCLTGPPDAATHALAAQLAEPEWHNLVHLACTRHRVAPVLALHLSDLGAPPAAVEDIRRETRVSSIQTLRQGAALRDLLAELDNAGVSPVVLKGLPLAEHLYASAGNRHARDIDILVPPSAIHASADVLHRLDYAPAPQYRLRGRLVGTRALAEECYDLEYHGGRTPLPVELHWRTSHYAGWPDFTEDPNLTQVQQTSIGPVRVPVDGANLIYLAGHGSMHAWARLKWLADIGRLAELRGAAGLEDDMILARRLGGEMPLALALRLSNQVFGTPLPAELERAGSSSVRLETQMLRVIATPEIAPGTWRYRLSANVVSLQLANGPAQVLGVLRYAVWRRLRLGMAGLLGALGGRPALQ